jgi:cytochrome oxidase Cu insertion factor (SCO1/SenC/PrrC family)
MTSIDTPEDLTVEPTPHASSWRVLWQVIAFGLVLALLGLLAWGLRKTRAGQIETGMAPDFTLTSFSGETLTLSELQGQVVVITLSRPGESTKIRV